MDSCEPPLFNNLLKLCDTKDEDTSSSKVPRRGNPSSLDGSYCASCLRLWRDSRYYSWGSLYTRSSLCAECQKGRARQDYISYWGCSQYRVGSWRLRQKWMNPDFGWMFTSRTEAQKSTDKISKSELSTERSWSKDFTTRSYCSISRSELSARSEEITPRSQPDLFTGNHIITKSSSASNTGQGKESENYDNADISVDSRASCSSPKLPQERRQRSKSPCLQKVDVASRKQMFEHSNKQSGKMASGHAIKNEPTVDDGRIDIPKLNLDDLDIPYNSPVYHFPLTPKHIPTVARPNRWVGYGYFVGTAELTSDTGHLLWVRPRGELHVIFKYADTGQDFMCFIDPQYTGVRLCQRKPDGELTVILDGRESPQYNNSCQRVSSVTRYPPQHNFKLVSYLGRIELLLQANKDNTLPTAQRFKINFTMTL
ncbi:uncharacterized protein LOC132548552 [Ylistrum balloti]|uniref:uncharacterized protein LOC132548552 n=1 Tax=Ylistrum balloti TaxID=509963 RepID=UPI002905D7F2|nr:uncharacterized protein LOC132548552 [Ylistrum balloti]